MKKLVCMAVIGGFCAGTAMAATMMTGYTPGAGSLLSVDNGGQGSVLFVDYAALGGDNTGFSAGVKPSLTVLIDGAGQWRIGDTVEITGFALPLRGPTASGTFTFDIRQGSGGIGDSGAGGLASLGTATALHTTTNNQTMYVNFDSPVSFLVDTNTFKVGINISSTGQIETKTQGNYPVPRYDYNTGASLNPMQVSAAGNVTAVAVTTNSAPVFDANPFSKPTAYEALSYNETLLDVASDPDNDAIVFSIGSFTGPGSDWLGIDGSSVTGTPQTANIGTCEWVVQAVDAYGGTNTATMSIEVFSNKGFMLQGYNKASSMLSPNGETLFVDEAASGGSTDPQDADGFATWQTVKINGAGIWDSGDTVTITGFAMPLKGGTVNGTMTFEIREAAGGFGTAAAGGLSALGSATATFGGNGITSTYYVNFETPVTFDVNSNSTDIAINFSNSGNIAYKSDATFTPKLINYSNGNFVGSGHGMKASVAGYVIKPDGAKYGIWVTDFGVTNGPSDDHDNDGLINLYEYGLGGDPTNGFVDGNIPTFGEGPGGLEYVYAQRSDNPTLVYYLELTPSLTVPAWTNLGYTVTGTNVTVGTVDFVTNLIDTADSAKFIKLRIEQTP